jgi:hypothetical protein
MFYKKGSKDGIYYDGERNMESFEYFMINTGETDDLDGSRSNSENKASQDQKPVKELTESNFQEYISDGNFHFVKFCKKKKFFNLNLCSYLTNYYFYFKLLLGVVTV